MVNAMFFTCGFVFWYTIYVMYRNGSYKIKHKLIVLSVCLIMSFYPFSGSDADTRLFVPKEEKATRPDNKKSFFKRLFNIPDKTHMHNATRLHVEKTKQASSRVSHRRTGRQKPSVNMSAMEFYKSARNIDPDLLKPGGRDPQTVEELMQVAAALNTPKVAGLLEMRRKNRRATLKIAEQHKRDSARMARLRQYTNSASQKEDNTTKSKQPVRNPVFVPKQTPRKPARVFTDFR